MNRRNFIGGMAAILAAGRAPAAISSGVLMPLGKVWTPAHSMTATEVLMRQQIMLDEIERAVFPPIVMLHMEMLRQLKRMGYVEGGLAQPRPSRTAQETSLMKRAADQRMHGIHASFRDEILHKTNVGKRQQLPI